MKYILILIIRCYQLTVGILFRGSCRFHPTCSEYTLQSIQKYGTIKGFLMGFKRISKCHPYSNTYGIDEV
ncbi:MAG: membrane protein insertion efficiency factor YidD [bacterium TMED6]|nr:MAG: membrane protein insertion efficiency factor YidD [bacterium TMED6]